MGFKSGPIALTASDADIFECPATFEGAAVLAIANVGAGAGTYTIKFYKQSTAETIAIASAVSIAANTVVKFPAPLSMEPGDKLIGAAATGSIVVTPTVTLGGSTASKGLKPRGEYSGSATYAENDLVSVASTGASYISMADGNTGNAPVSSPSQWMLNSAKGETGETGGIQPENNGSDFSDPAATLVNLGGSPKTRDINAQTGTTYTFVLTDAGKPCTFTNAAAVTVTVPPNSSVAFPVGTQIEVVQSGAGKVTLAQGAGVTINSLGSNKSLAGQYAGATLLKTATDTWLLAGSLTP